MLVLYQIFKMKERNLANIQFNRKYNYIPKEVKDREVIGFDSETYDGKITLLTDSLENYVIPHNFNDSMEFLEKNNERYKNSLNFFFNLEYDTNALIKWLPEKNILELIEFGRTVYNGEDKFNIEKELINESFKYNNDNLENLEKTVNNEDNLLKEKVLKNADAYYISLLKQKYLKITNPKRRFRIMFFDIAHFYQLGSLQKTYYKVFDRVYKKRITNRENGFDYTDINDNVIQYCIEDSKKCQELAYDFVKLCDSFVYVKHFFSPASLSKALLKKELNKYECNFVNSETQQYALNSYQGGRFETFKKGYFDKIFVYDINSAYPSIYENLAIPNGLHITNSKYEKNSLYSYFKCNLNLKSDEIISPLKYFLTKKNLLIYPLGKIKEVYLTKKEYEFLLKYDIDIDIIKAKHIINDNPIYPFKFIKDLYSKRMELKKLKNRKEHIIKISANSLYGITIQLTKRIELKKEWSEDEESNPDNEIVIYNDRIFLKTFKWVAGEFFNPIFATEITSQIRIKLLEDSFNNQKNIIMFATDSIISDKKLDNLKIDNQLGSYKLENDFALKGVVLGNGIYQFSDGYERKKGFRGFNTNLNIIELLEKNKNKTIIDIQKYKPFKLKESRTHLEDLNNFSYVLKQLNINSDNKRIWDRDFENCNDALNSQIDSKPIVLN